MLRQECFKISDVKGRNVLGFLMLRQECFRISDVKAGMLIVFLMLSGNGLQYKIFFQENVRIYNYI